MEVIDTNTVVNRFICNLSDTFSKENLQEISIRLSIFLNNYDVCEKSTDVAIAENDSKEKLKMYIVARSIEGLSDKTLEQYYIHLRDLLVDVNKDIKDISANDIRLHMHYLITKRNISKVTLNNRRASIRAFFEWCKNEGFINDNPCKNIKPVKCKSKEVKPLSREEIGELYNSCSNSRDKALFLFLLFTGCRVTELERLNINDVNLNTNEVYLFGKGDKERKCYISNLAVEALMKYLNERADENVALFVTLRRPHRRLRKDGIENVIRKIGAESCVERRIYPHLFRHTTASLLRNGMLIEEIQKILGHENINTTMIYVDICEEEIKKKYNSIMNNLII